MKNTKLVCTIGPSTDTVEQLIKMIKAGMNVARLNFSHGTHENHAFIIKNIRQAEKETGKRIAILQDLQGPKIRIGKMPENGISVKTGDIVKITINDIVGEKTEKGIIIPTDYKEIAKDTKAGDTLKIEDGKLEAKITEVEKDYVICEMTIGGIIKTRKGINLPDTTISAPILTEKDLIDIKFGAEQNVDLVAISFVKDASDVLKTKEILKSLGKRTPVISKVERKEALKNLEEIVQASSGIMVARGDLGTDIPAERVPIIQKQLIRLANKYGKPVITATEVLQSMVDNARATRAEISDAANAIFDHTDAIMLSNESAVGEYPIKAIQTLTNVANEVEKHLATEHEILDLISSRHKLCAVNATCLSACSLANEIDADAVIIYTKHGFTAKHVAKHRLYKKMIVITPSEKAARELQLVWGINHVIVKELTNQTLKIMAEARSIAEKEGLIKKEAAVVFVANASKMDGVILSSQVKC